MRTSPVQPPIVVLAGGPSPEREISLQSGAAVATALRHGGFPVEMLDPIPGTLQDYSWSPQQLAFIMLHGTYGEDGTVQAELDACGIRYTGASQAASHRAFHKSLAKACFAAAGVPTPTGVAFTGSVARENLPGLFARFRGRVVVKPDAQGSSLGVSLVTQLSDLSAAIDEAFGFGQTVLIEELIDGEEWTVPVLDGVPLPSIRVQAKRQFFDYQAKYLDAATTYEVLLPEESETARRVTDVSLSACAALGVSGICRVDLIVDRQGKPWVLEVNTVPGMTDHSLVPKSAARLGWDMTQLCRRILLPWLPDHYSR